MKCKLLILSLLLVVLCSLSAVGAVDELDNATDIIAVDELYDSADVIAVEEESGDDSVILSSGENESALSVVESEGKLSEDDRIPTILIVNKTLTRVANDYYDAGETGGVFYAVLKDINGNPLADKKVQIAVNGPIYNVTTNKEGQAILEINLVSANVYTYALSFSGDDDYSAAPIASTRLTITKKPTNIVASNKVFKKSAKNKKITVSFKTSVNPYDKKMYLSSKKVILLKIGNKKYYAKTNSKNKATFSISLNKKGKYTGKLSFEGTKTYAASSKSIKITVK